MCASLMMTMKVFNALCVKCIQVDGGSGRLRYREVQELSRKTRHPVTFHMRIVFLSLPVFFSSLSYTRVQFKNDEQQRKKTQNKKENGISSSVSPYKLVRL